MTPHPQSATATGIDSTGDGNTFNVGVLNTGVSAEFLVDYARKETEAKAVAEGFIREMARKIAADANLDLEGMKQAVRNAIEIYVTTIAAGPVETNVDAIIALALKNAKAQVNEGRSADARATLRVAAEKFWRKEQERRDGAEQGLRLLYTRERDIALAAYNGEAAAQAVLEMAEALHGDNHERLWQELTQEEYALYVFGRDQGSNVHLVAAIAVARHREQCARTPDEKGYARNAHGIALATLGERESGNAHLEEAVAAYRAALGERARERVPLDWAATQNNLGVALQTLGGRESGTARLEEAVAAYRAALGECTRERVPLDWAMTQNNLGNALLSLGERQSGTARLQEAVAAYRAALEERTRERVPLDWAMTQTNLGTALLRLGERQSGTARLEAAVAAYRAALEERTRERVPLDWATTQNNLGNALSRLGERESGTARLQEAVAAYRAALEERSRERVPLQWAMSLGNQGVTMRELAARTDDAALARQALEQIEAAEQTMREGGHAPHAEYYRTEIPAAKALVERLSAPTE